MRNWVATEPIKGRLETLCDRSRLFAANEFIGEIDDGFFVEREGKSEVGVGAYDFRHFWEVHRAQDGRANGVARSVSPFARS